MKTSKEDSSLEESNENERSLSNRLQAEQDLMEKNSSSMDIEEEIDFSAISTEAAPDEGNNAMEIDDTSSKELGNNNKILGATTTLAPNNGAPINASDLPATASVSIPVSAQLFQRFLQKGVIANDDQLNKPRSMVESYRPLDG